MKYRILFFIVLISCFIPAQKITFFIKAKTNKAIIEEGLEYKSTWRISPNEPLDIYTLSKSPGSKKVIFKTDIDSLSISLKPGEHFDFTVILNEKDSCKTRIESLPLKNYASQKPVERDTIPFRLSSYNNIIIQVLVNKKDTIQLAFDTGTTDFEISEETFKSKLSSVQSWKKENQIQIGNQNFKNQKLYPIETKIYEADGLFGWNLFDGKIVEIDYDKKLMIVHTQLPDFIKHQKSYNGLELHYIHDYLCIDGTLQLENKKFSSTFLFDSGYQKTLLLNSELLKKQGYPLEEQRVLKETTLKNNHMQNISTMVIRNEKLILGKIRLKNVSAQVTTGESPTTIPLHILGNEILKYFNTILDFQENKIYLKRNKLLY